jgi:hypothetical protein
VLVCACTVIVLQGRAKQCALALTLCVCVQLAERGSRLKAVVTEVFRLGPYGGWASLRINAVVPPCPLIQYQRFTATRKKN